MIIIIIAEEKFVPDVLFIKFTVRKIGMKGGIKRITGTKEGR